MSKSLKHKTWVEISKRALVNNAQAFRDIIHKDVRMMGVVKSNAYGHGLIDTAKTIDPYVDWFGVDNLDEAKLLKKNKIKKPILTLGFTPSWRMAEAARMGVSIVVASEEQLRAARAGSKKTKRKLKVHIKVETGTTRQGFSPNKLPDVGKMILDSKYLKFEGLSTHFADIEDTTDHAYAGRQLENFIKSIELLEAHGIEPEIKHTACTAAAAVYPDTHFDLVRVGIGLYGIWPSEETKRAVGDSGANLPLEPALTWKTRIAQIKEVKSGTPISYGLTEKMPYNGKLAVLGVGYWDGLDRALSGRGEVIIRGRKAKIMGRVCMNMCMVDVTDIPGVKPEDEVILIGKSGELENSAADVAKNSSTIAYEVVTRINPTTPRLFK